MRGVGTEETGEKQEGFPLRHFFHPEAGVPILAFSSFLSCCREQRLDDSEIHPEPRKVFGEKRKSLMRGPFRRARWMLDVTFPP